MNIITVNKINKQYKAKAKEENYEVNNTIDICIASSDVLAAESLIGTEADTLAFGEFTRRFNSAMINLEQLINNI